MSTQFKTAAAVLVVFAGVLLGGAGLAVGIGEDPPPRPAVAASAAPGGEVPAKDKGRPPARVTVRQPLQRNLAPYEDFTGRLEAVRTVEVRARLNGVLTSAPVKEGTAVKKGDLLFEIDPAEFKAALAQAEAQLVIAEARHTQATRELARVLTLFKEGIVRQVVVDQKRGDAEAAAAEREVARANVARARQILETTRVLAPLDGLVGRRSVDPGNLVSGGDRATLLTTVTQVEPIAVRFGMNERNFLRYRRLLEAGQVKGPSQPLSLGVADETGFPHQGILDSFEARVDPKTGTIAVRGLFPNPKRLLLPGMFARVRMAFGKPRPVLAVPEAAILAGNGKRAVLVVNDKLVERRAVTLGQRDGALRVVESGLQPGDWVVVEGLKTVWPGDRVEPRREQNP
jgi:multidrug efflux system membrane fusion protein